MRDKKLILLSIFFIICVVYCWSASVFFFSYEMMFNVQYCLENSYILPLQEEFHIGFELESEEVF